MVNKKEMQNILDLSSSKKKMDIISKALDDLSNNMKDDEIDREDVIKQIDEIANFAADN